MPARQESPQATELPTALPSFLWHFVRRHPLAHGAIALASFTWTLDQVAWPYIFKLLIDGITSYRGDKALLFQALSQPLWLMFALWAAVEIGFRIQGALMAVYFPRMRAAIQRAMFAYAQLHSYRYFSDRPVGSIADKIGGQISESATTIMQLVALTFLPACASACIAMVMMGRLHPIFAWTLGGWCMIEMAAGVIGGKGINSRVAEQAEARSALHGAVVDSLSGHAAIRLYARNSYEAAYVERYRDDWMRKDQIASFYQEKMRLIRSFFGGAAYLGLIWLALYGWQQNRLTTGDVVYVILTTWNIMTIIWQMASTQIPNFFQQVGVCTQAMRTVLVPYDLKDAPDAKELKADRGEIVFENVSFHYVPGRDIFCGKNVAIRPGEKVGLVGFSGSGKSTFVNLILRLYDVESGRILIDGQDIARVTQDSLHKAIAMIPQDTTLFHRTLMDNIRYGRVDATENEAIEASKRAHCHEFISRLKDGYDALVGERGVKLSGGQRQRIAIARAILKNAPVLILDEATSSLDSVTEAYIQESLHRLMQGCTTIVIAHRLSTLSAMDRLLVFKDGEIIEDGSHQELLAAGGHYAMLWNMQAGGFLQDAEE